MRSRRVQGAGLELAVWERGDPAGPTVVLVHGFPDTSAVWTPIAELLAGTGHHVVTYDVRGAGGSDAPRDRDGYRIDLLIDDLRAVVDATSPDRPVHVVGHDWGSIQGWEAVASPRLSNRVASYTSISGPPLGHAGAWMRARLRDRSLRALASQGIRSSYILGMHLPGVARAARRLGRRGEAMRTAWTRGLRRAEGVVADADWPAPTFGTDVANGLGLYLANIRPRLRRPEQQALAVPVQLIVARRDRYVTPRLLDGLEAWAPDLRRVEIDATHWVPRSHPDEIASLIAGFVASAGAAGADAAVEVPARRS